MDKVAFGRKGEIFVMQKLLSLGWEFPKAYPSNMEGLDWVFEKNSRKIKVQVKTFGSKKEYSCMGEKNFDFLILNDLKDIWIIPNFMFNNTNKLNKTFKKLKNAFHILDIDNEYDLVNEINDLGIPYSKILPIKMQELPSIALIH